MTLEETYKYFKEMTENYGSYELCPCFADDMEMAKIALSALEKQIPKKTIFLDGCPRIYVCGSCGYCLAGRNDPNVPIITVALKPYCPNCGQLIDWSDA